MITFFVHTATHFFALLGARHIMKRSISSLIFLLCMSHALLAQSDDADSVHTDDSTLLKPSFRLLVDGGRVWTPIAPEDTTQIVRLGLSLGIAPHGGLDFTNRITNFQNQIVLLPLSIAFQAGFRIAPHWEIDVRMPINPDGYDRNALLGLYNNIIPSTARSQDIKLRAGMMVAGSIIAGLRYSVAPHNRSGFMFSFGGGAMVVYRSGYTLSYLTNEIVVPQQTEVLPTFSIIPQYRWRFSNQWSMTADFFGIQWVYANTLRFHSLAHYLTMSFHF